MSAKPIFIGGTGSHVGKSWVATAICRYLHRMGHSVAPFKAQNMSNNSAVCPNGGEIGRAQAAQAEACGIEPHSDMNPILLKPTGRLGSQVVLHGRPWQTLSARDYYDHFDYLLEQVLTSYSRLAERYSYIVIEGAGSISELNLKQYDLVNLGLATRIGAPCLLVADIDRGGAFASVIGTFKLLDQNEAPLVHSFLINRFRGDSSLFSDGITILEQNTGKPCLGVFPFVDNVELDAEDSLSIGQDNDLRCAAPHQMERIHRVAILRFPHISNFTDFRLLPDAVYLTRPVQGWFDAIVLPGTKSTIEDMLWLRNSGMENWLMQQIEHGSHVIGICGGYQMLGERIVDPHAVESTIDEVAGLGLLPAETYLTQDKITRTVAARTPSGIRFFAYEIHMGITTLRKTGRPFAILADGVEDGIRTERVTGTYLHGAFESKPVLEEVIGHALPERSNDKNDKDVHYDRLAGWFAEHVNQERFAVHYL